MQLVAIAYVSSARRLLRSHELDALLADARAFNARLGVTGALLHGEGSFFQYFEGEPAAVDEVYARIKRATTHHGLIELLRDDIGQRLFADWHMGFGTAPRSLMQELAQARWGQALNALASTPDASSGSTLLQDYWMRVRDGLA
jgi:hypothetical protein